MRAKCTLRPILTEKRKEWLEHLKKHGPSNRDRSVVGFHCMRLGWTDWARNEDGSIREPYAEVITDAGIEALANAKGAHDKEQEDGRV